MLFSRSAPIHKSNLAVPRVLTSRDRMMALEGVAGGGKTTSLAAVREGAARAGYQVEGLAPTSRAAQKLAEVGIETHTLQRHLSGASSQTTDRSGPMWSMSQAWPARSRYTRSWSG